MAQGLSGRTSTCSTAAPKTAQPWTRSLSRVSSSKQWLLPAIDGTNSMALGMMRLTGTASCRAPDTIRRHRPGTRRSAALVSVLTSAALRGAGGSLAVTCVLISIVPFALMFFAIIWARAVRRLRRACSGSRICSVASVRPGTMDVAFGLTVTRPKVHTVDGPASERNASSTAWAKATKPMTASSGGPSEWFRHGSDRP